MPTYGCQPLTVPYFPTIGLQSQPPCLGCLVTAVNLRLSCQCYPVMVLLTATGMYYPENSDMVVLSKTNKQNINSRKVTFV
jgi:hypothetical protein